MLRRVLVGAVLALSAAGAGCGKHGADAEARVAAAGTVTQVAGKVTATPAAGGAARVLAAGDTVASDDTIATGDDGDVQIRLARNGALLHLEAHQNVRLDASISWKLPQQAGGSDVVAGDPSQVGLTAAGRPAEREAAHATQVGAPPAETGNPTLPQTADRDDRAPMHNDEPAPGGVHPSASQPPPPPPPPPVLQPRPPVPGPQVQPTPTTTPTTTTPTAPPARTQSVAQKLAPPSVGHGGGGGGKNMTAPDDSKEDAKEGGETARATEDPKKPTARNTSSAAFPANAAHAAKVKACFASGSGDLVLAVGADGKIASAQRGGASVSADELRCVKGALADVTLTSGSYRLAIP